MPPKATKPKSTKPKGPSYFDMAKSAILALKERSGSSLQAIKKYIESVRRARARAACGASSDAPD